MRKTGKNCTFDIEIYGNYQTCSEIIYLKLFNDLLKLKS